MKKTIKFLHIVIFVIIIASLLTACDDGNKDEPIPIIPSGPDATSLSISPTTKSITLGEIFKLNITVEPVEAPIISCVSSNPNIAIIDSEGNIISKGLGQTEINITAKGGLSKICTVNVTPSFTIKNFEHSNDLNKVVYGNEIFVGGGDYGKIAWSDDGINWTLAENSQFGNEQNDIIYGMAYGNGIFVAVGRNTTVNFYTYEGRISWSDDGGKTWTLVSEAPLSPVLSVVFTGNNFYASSSTNVFTSTDGKIWKLAGTPFGTNNYSIGHLVYGNDMLVAVRLSSYDIAYSKDGKEWTVIDKSSLPFNSSIVDIAFGNEKFVAITDGKSPVVNSYDGITWEGVVFNTFSNPFFANSPQVISYGEGIFFAGGNFASVYSIDAITWWKTNISGSYYWIVIGNGKVVLGYNGNRICYAPIKAN